MSLPLHITNNLSFQEEKKLAVHSLDKALEFNPSYLKALVRRGGLHEELGNLDESLQDYTKVLELDPCHKMAKQATIVSQCNIHYFVTRDNQHHFPDFPIRYRISAFFFI